MKKKDRAKKEADRLRLIQDKALRAVRIELRDSDWMSLDKDIAWKILAMFPKRDNSRVAR